LVVPVVCGSNSRLKLAGTGGKSSLQELLLKRQNNYLICLRALCVEKCRVEGLENLKSLRSHRRKWRAGLRRHSSFFGLGVNQHFEELRTYRAEVLGMRSLHRCAMDLFLLDSGRVKH
jgi:hypothetical protein